MFQVGEDLETVKTTYLALNSQLVTELPVLVQVNKSSPPVCSLISVVLLALSFFKLRKQEYASVQKLLILHHKSVRLVSDPLALFSSIVSPLDQFLLSFLFLPFSQFFLKL